MTDEQKHEQLGRLMTDYKKNEEELAQLEAKASQMGRKLEEIGRALASRPAGVHLQSEGFDMRYGSACAFMPNDLDTQTIVGMCAEIRKKIEQESILAGQLTKLGFPPHRDQ